MKVLGVFTLPDEIKHLEHDPVVVDKVFSTWEHKRNTACNEGFDVDIYGLKVHFEEDFNRCGIVQSGEYSGYCQIAMKSFIKDPLNESQLAQIKASLKIMENTLNAQIAKMQPQPDFGLKLLGAKT